MVNCKTTILWKDVFFIKQLTCEFTTVCSVVSPTVVYYKRNVYKHYLLFYPKLELSLRNEKVVLEYVVSYQS